MQFSRETCAFADSRLNQFGVRIGYAPGFRAMVTEGVKLGRNAYLGQLKASGVDLETVDPSAVAFAAALDSVAEVAPNIAESIVAELEDQRSHLKLIASENYASPSVLLAMGNWLSDKYAEGAPRHRWYAGCDNVDDIESFAVAKAKEVFGADHAYVQPHSGIDANLVAFWTILTKRVEAPALEALGQKDVNALTDEEWETLRRSFGEQKMMGMALDAGGHLTHGFRPNISGKLFQRVQYSVDPETGVLDYAQVREVAQRERPLVIVAGYSSYPRKLNFAKFKEIADEVGAVLMVDMAHFAGLVAGKVFTGDYDPVAHADIVTTTTHKTLRGPRGGMVMCKAEFADTLDRGCPLVLGGPLEHIIAAKAVALTEAAKPEFQTYARNIVENAAALAEGLLSNGATLQTGGTDNHLVLVDVRSYGLTGRQAESAMRECGMTVNRNVIPYDPNGSWYTSGIRLGAPALTTLGFTPDEMRDVARDITQVLSAAEPVVSEKSASLAKYRFTDDTVPKVVSEHVRELLAAHPLYPNVGLGSLTPTAV